MTDVPASAAAARATMRQVGTTAASTSATAGRSRAASTAIDALAARVGQRRECLGGGKMRKLNLLTLQ